MQPTKIGRGWFAALLLVAFTVRLGAALVWQSRLPPDQPFQFGDSQSYWDLAGTIYRGEPYLYGEDQVFRAPGYPVLLAGWFAIWGSDSPPLWWARLIGVFCGTAAVGCIALLGTHLFDPRAGLVAGWLACFYPGAIGMSVFILSEAAFCPLMVLHLLSWLRAHRATSNRPVLEWSALGGVCAGLATLVRPSWLLILPFGGALSIMGSRSRKRQAVIVATMLIVSSATMLPWWVRNYRVTGKWVPTTLQTGASLYDGLNPLANGASNMDFSMRQRNVMRQQDLEAPQPPATSLELRLDNRLRQQAMQWAVNHPRRVVELMGIKLVRFWNPLPNADEFQGLLPRLIVVFGYLPILGCAVWGTVNFRRRGWEIWMLWMPAVYFSSLHLIFVSSIRYRQPAVLVLTILAAAIVTQRFGASSRSTIATQDEVGDAATSAT